MKLLIISNMAHYYRGEQIVGWGPTVQEINHLASLFDLVHHIGFLYHGHAPASSLPYSAENISLVPLPPSGGDKLRDKMALIKQTPVYLSTIFRELKDADVVHLRCPANIPLLGLVVLLFKRKPKFRWVKYAGNWQPEGKEPLTYRLQRWLLQKNLHRGVVTINGIWPNQPEHIYTFNNPSMTHNEYTKALEFSRHKSLTLPIHLLFVGRLEQPKGVERLLKIANELKKQKIDFNLTLIGDGPLRQQYETWVKTNQLSDRVQFTGWLPFQALQHHYQWAHLLLLPSSASEGWPKVLSEGMAHGVVPIASTVSSIPQTLSQIGAGKAIPPDQVTNYVEAILEYAENPAIWETERDNCALAGVRYTYQAYLHDVRKMFTQAWQIELIP